MLPAPFTDEAEALALPVGTALVYRTYTGPKGGRAMGALDGARCTLTGSGRLGGELVLAVRWDRTDARSGRQRDGPYYYDIFARAEPDHAAQLFALFTGT